MAMLTKQAWRQQLEQELLGVGIEQDRSSPVARTKSSTG